MCEAQTAKIAVRNLQADEWLLWKRLRLEALTDTPDAFGETLDRASLRSDADWKDFAVSATMPDRRAFLAERDGFPVGMARLHLSGEGHRYAHLYAMWVKPAGRGSGVGRALVETAVAWAISAGATAVALHVTEGNMPALRLYSACGFVDSGEREPLRPGSSLLTKVMVRRFA